MHGFFQCWKIALLTCVESYVAIIHLIIIHACFSLMVKKLHNLFTCIIFGGLSEKNITYPLKLLSPLLEFIFALCTNSFNY
jgi:hypothetical protein